MVKKEAVFTDVPARVNADQLEREVLAYWERERIFERSLEQTKDGQLYTFYDGPPYATGKPHYGSILQSVIKDTVLRYKTMQGFNVPRRVGWDTHGLPVETLVEKELGFKTKKDIEAYGIAKFNQRCRETVFRHIDDFTETLKRVGRWADYQGAYATLDRDYMESEWWVFKQLWEQGLVYQAFRSTPYCIRCATPLSNFEVSMAYKDKTDTALYVKMRVRPAASNPSSEAGLPGGYQDTYLLIWTTTPWTLPGNMAVAVNPDIAYVSVRHEGQEIVVARERVASVFGNKVEVVREWSVGELRQLTYEPLYPEPVAGSKLPATKQVFRVVSSDHVSVDEGTGLVHIAPAFGEEDAELGREYELPVLRTVDPEGRFNKLVPQWVGKKVFDVNDEVIADLMKRGLLFKQEEYTHSYPFCWRCEEPLIYYALDTWFVRVTELKERMLAINEKIHWTPKHVKTGRFAKGIESAPDWAVSRNRFWSVPLPVWECDGDDCELRVCVGSVEELSELAQVTEIKDIHRPFVDELTWPCKECAGTMRRVEEVLDVWFDSGSMPYSQWHYPFANKEFVEKGFPADFIAEGLDQTRTWFYVLHVLATALTKEDIGLGQDQPAYKNVIASGIIFAEDGQKLSKKLKNFPDPEPTIAKYGADVLRLYLLSSTTLGEPYRFSEKELQQLQRNMYLTLWNVYSFFTRYANTHGWSPGQYQQSSHLLDRWLMYRLTNLEYKVVRHSDNYRVDLAARELISYVDDLSNWYVRRSRHRFQKPQDDQEQEEAFGTLHQALLRVAIVLAPFMPFIAEFMYRNLTDAKSVHLQSLPKLDDLRRKDAASDSVEVRGLMDQVRTIVSLGLAARADAGIKVRQPLAGLDVSVGKGTELPDGLKKIIRDEVNVDELGVQVVSDDDLPSSGVLVVLDKEITPELRQRGLAREIIRHGQVLRRKAGYALDDRINLVFGTDDKELQAVLNEQRESIFQALQADEVIDEAGREDAGVDLKIGDGQVHLGVLKV